MNGDTILIIVVGGLMLLTFLIALLLFVGVFNYWLQAFLTGVRLSSLDILGMRLRRTNVQAVVRQLIMARQAGAEVSPREMEAAYHQGVDLEKVTLAHIQATKDRLEFRFQNLVDAELQGRLAEKLKP